jgi:hypothetical protein
MKRFIVLVAATFWSLPAAAAQTPYVCGRGSLLDVEAVTETIPTQTVVITKTKRNKRGDREERTHVSPSSRESKSYLVTIQLDDMRYGRIVRKRVLGLQPDATRGERRNWRLY